jgi:Cu/Ag efflux protein CusF
MAHTSRIVIVIICAALIGAAACNKQPVKPVGPAAAVAANTYKGVGVVKSINTKVPAIEIDHQDIDGLMPAMQMEFPVSDASLLNGIAINDHIDFTIEAAKGEMKVIAITKK